MNCRTIWLVAGTGVLCLIGPLAGVANDCRIGTEQVGETVSGNVRTIYCACSGEIAKLKNIETDMKVLQERIKQDRNAIMEWDKQLPDYLKSLDEWVGMDEKAREETRRRAREAATTTFLELLRIQAIQNANVATARTEQVTRAQLDALWNQLNSGPLASPEFQAVLRHNARGAAAARRWTNFEEFVDAVEIIRTAMHGIHDARQEEYARAFIAILSLGLRDPRASILVAEVDFAASALVGNAVAWTAKHRVEALLKLGDQRLAAIASLSKTYRNHVDQFKDLSRARTEIYRRGSDASVSCPS